MDISSLLQFGYGPAQTLTELLAKFLVVLATISMAVILLRVTGLLWLRKRSVLGLLAAPALLVYTAIGLTFEPSAQLFFWAINGLTLVAVAFMSRRKIGELVGFLKTGTHELAEPSTEPLLLSPSRAE